jgi:hypothetical protein
MEESQAKTPEVKPEDRTFESVYANNTQIETSFWDLKILFGQLEQHTGKTAIDLHTAVTLPWPQAKLLGYYLRLHTAWHESQNGRIGLLPSLIPPIIEIPAEPEELTPETLGFYEFARRVHQDTFGS